MSEAAATPRANQRRNVRRRHDHQGGPSIPRKHWSHRFFQLSVAVFVDVGESLHAQRNPTRKLRCRSWSIQRPYVA
ncbi:hypothetical protein PISMIDRAFT_680308 [Pisolithus microcarpus 441]|uniref:Uncharacterized protein n=1 Tax=Pisolithus microcarpus 441 TaxID=765257 RepID=A0A0C9ZRE4_9AGAM|nr:hypothetical protein PISMIDRAFT_680308 [Pisolithus microcarpus 441]